MALLGGLFKLLAAGEAVEGVTGAKTLLGKTMESVVTRPIKNTIIQGLGGNPAQEIRQLGANLKNFKQTLTHPVQEFNRRYDFFNLSVQDYVRTPILESGEFRVDNINQNDPIRSINKIHASIISNLNVVNKNTVLLFDYTRKSISAQDDKIDEITKIQDKNQKTHDDLERRYTRLSSQIRDLEASRQGVTGGGAGEEDEETPSQRESPVHEGIWDKIKDLLTEVGEGALGLYGLRKVRNLVRGRRPGRGARIRTRVGAAAEIEKQATEKAARRVGRETGIVGEEIGKEAGKIVRRPGFWGRVMRQAGRGGAIGGALEAATELKQLEQRDTEHTVRSKVRKFFGIHETEEERREPAPWNRHKNEAGEETPEAYTLKKQNILMESMMDIKFSAISNMDVRARRINLKASDSIVFDAPKIVFTSHPIIREYEKGSGTGGGRGKPFQTLKTRALSPDEVLQQQLPSELYQGTPMMPGGAVGGFSGGGGGGGAPRSPYYDRQGRPSSPYSGRRGGGGGGKGPVRPADTLERFEKTAREGTGAVPYTTPRTETSPPDIDRAIENLPPAIRETARGYIQNLSPEERADVISGKKSVRDLIQEKGGPMARSLVESQYPQELDRFQREVTTPTTRSVPAMPEQLTPRMGSDRDIPTYQKGQKFGDKEVPAPFSLNTGGIDRSQFADELRNNPALARRVAEMVKGEVGFNPNASDFTKQLIQAESAFNRSQVRNHSLEQGLLSIADDPNKGYYARDTYTNHTPMTDQEFETFKKKVLDPVLQGSDEGTKFLGRLVTGNASEGNSNFASRRLAEGKYTAGRFWGDDSKSEMFTQEAGDTPKLGNLKRLPDTQGEPGQFSPIATYGLDKGSPYKGEAVKGTDLPSTQIKPYSPSQTSKMQSIPEAQKQDASAYKEGTIRLEYAEGNLSGVEPKLLHVLQQSTKDLPPGYHAEIISGHDSRTTGTTNHPSGIATDIKIYDENNNLIPHDRANHPGAIAYERLAQSFNERGKALYPDEKWIWGGTWTGQAAGNGDVMHYQIFKPGVGSQSSGQYDWEGGINRAARPEFAPFFMKPDELKQYQETVRGRIAEEQQQSDKPVEYSDLPGMKGRTIDSTEQGAIIPSEGIFGKDYSQQQKDERPYSWMDTVFPDEYMGKKEEGGLKHPSEETYKSEDEIFKPSEEEFPLFYGKDKPPLFQSEMSDDEWEKRKLMALDLAGKGRRDSYREGEIIPSQGQIEGDEATKGGLYVDEKIMEQNLKKQGSLEKQGILENKGYYDQPEGLHFPEDKFNPYTGQPLAKQISDVRNLNEQEFNKAFAGTKLEGKYDSVVNAANKHGISPTLLAATIALETGYGKSRAIRDYSIDEGIEKAAQIAAKNYVAGGENIRGMGALYSPIGTKNGVTKIDDRLTASGLDYREKYQDDDAEKIDDDIRKAESVEKEKQEENAVKDDKEEKQKQDEQKDDDKPASKEVEKIKEPRHDPEAESPGANDDGYGSQHRNSGDMTGTTDHDADLDS